MQYYQDRRANGAIRSVAFPAARGAGGRIIAEVFYALPCGNAEITTEDTEYTEKEEKGNKKQYRLQYVILTSL